MKNIISINFTNSGVVDLVTRLNTGTNEVWLSILDADGGSIDLGTGSAVSITSDNFSYQINSALWVGDDALTVELSKSSTTYTYTINKIDELTGDIYIQKDSATVFTPVKKEDSRKELVDFFYPIGSYYETTDTDFDPNTTWGGTWELEAEGLVHISAGENYAVSVNDKDGGASQITYTPAGTNSGGAVQSHTLTVAEMPSHTHASRITVTYNGNAGNYRSSFATNSNWWNNGAGGYDTNNNVRSTGGGKGHSHEFTPPTFTGEEATLDNMQPYKIVNRWHRTA